MRFQKAEKGPIVPFDASKITSAVLKAMSACGLPSEDMAKKVTRDVMKQIGELNQELVSFEEVQDLVERALMKRGLYDIAKAYILYREDHARARKAIKVRDKTKGKQDVTDASMLMVQSLSSSTVSSWDRNKITQKLVEVLGMDMLEASSVAKEVENHIIGSGMTEISSAFIRETVNSVLAARGYQGQLKDLTMYQLPGEFIEDLMHTKSKENSNIVANNPEAVNLAIAETILKQYALEHVFDKRLKQAHISGQIHLHDLGYPIRLYAFSGRETAVVVKLFDAISIMTMQELWDIVDVPEEQLNETQVRKCTDSIKLEVQDRNRWVKVEQLVLSRELKQGVRIHLQNGSLQAVTAEHGVVVSRAGKFMLVRADEVRPTDKLVRIKQ